jgi:puromycin-sensitive aminopeptidase
MTLRRSFIAVSSLVTVFLLSHVPTPAKAPEAAEKFERLPAICQPESYELYFEPDLDHAAFEGSETLRFNLSEASRELVLNSVDLSIYDAAVARFDKSGHGDWIKAEVNRDNDHEKVAFKFPSALKSGDYELSLKFSGRLNKNLEGFYLSTFKDKDGKEQRIATTQMEPTDARRMFPCLDEPGYKAKFKVTVAAAPELAVIANAAGEFEKLDQRKGKKVVSFKPTPPMSTYLFCLVVGPLKATEPTVACGKKIRVWFPEGKEKLASFSQSIATKLLPYYENYFGQPYPLDKLDLIAIPDFSAGAMENLGAVTFRDTALLVDETNSSLNTRMRVADVVAHEMAHLWFGDLVTMNWWDDLWLNEAFATWMAQKAVAELKPEWRLWDDFAVERGSTLDLDSISATRAVRSPVNSPSDALEMFDEITYSKGASLLRMLETYLTEERFQKGIQLYMKEHAFANACTNDLWIALSRGAKDNKVDVSKLMAGWVNNPGCPVVSFSAQKGSIGYDLKLSQRRFYLDSAKSAAAGKNSSGTKTENLWQIPLQIADGSGKQNLEPVLLTASQLRETNKSEPLFLNGTGNGYFRTSFTSDQIARLKSFDLIKSLSTQERLSLLSDVFALAVAGDIKLDDYLTLATKFSHDEDRYVLGMLMGQFYSLNKVVDDQGRAAFEQYIRARLRPHLARLGWARRPGDDDLTASLRGSIISTLGTIGKDTEVLKFCRDKFEDYLSGKLESDLLSPVVGVVAYNGDTEEFTRISEAWRKAESPDIRNRNLYALADIRNDEVVERVLFLALSDEVKSQDAPGVLASLLAHTYSQKAAWKFLGEHYSEIDKKITERRVPRLIEACSGFCRPGQLAELKAFLDSHPMPSGRRAASKTIELATISTNFRERSGQSMPEVFAAQQ